MNQFLCASLFPHPLLAQSTCAIEYRKYRKEYVLYSTVPSTVLHLCWAVPCIVYTAATVVSLQEKKHFYSIHVEYDSEHSPSGEKVSKRFRWEHLL